MIRKSEICDKIQQFLKSEEEQVNTQRIRPQQKKTKANQVIEEARKAEETPTEPTAKSIEGFDEFERYITDKNNKELTNAKLAEILIRNGITDPKTGNKFYIRTPDGTKKKIAMLHGNSNPVTKTILVELLKKSFNDKKIKNYRN